MEDAWLAADRDPLPYANLPNRPLIVPAIYLDPDAIVVILVDVM